MINIHIEILEKAKTDVEETTIKFSQPADNIENYIKLKNYLDGTDWERTKEELNGNLNLSEIIVQNMEKFLINYDVTIHDYFESKSWIADLTIKRTNAAVRREEARPKLIKEQKLRSTELQKKMESVRTQTISLAICFDTHRALDYFTTTRKIMGELEEAEHNAKIYNEWEEALITPKTDFTALIKIREDFMKYYELWGFLYEKWSIRNEDWMRKSLTELELPEMDQTLKEGKILLSDLMEKFKSMPNILEIIHITMRDIKSFEELYSLLTILKSSTFKKHHWEMLWNNIYGNGTNRPEHPQSSVPLRKLLEDKLTSHRVTIEKIYKDAKNEFDLEQVVDELEKSAASIQVNITAFTIGDTVGFYIVKAIPTLTARLSDFATKVSEMLSRPDYPEKLLRRLSNTEGAIESTKKLLDLIDQIQKKLGQIAPLMKFKEVGNYMKSEVIRTFQQVRETFKECLEGITQRRKMLYFFQLFGLGLEQNDDEQDEPGQSKKNLKEDSGSEVMAKLKKILGQCDEVIAEQGMILRYARQKCPRLHLITDAQVVDLLTIQADPYGLVPNILVLFRGINYVKVEGEQNPYIDGVRMTDGTYLSLMSKVGLVVDTDKSNFYICKAINELEIEIKKVVKDNIRSNLAPFFMEGYKFKEHFKLVTNKKMLFQVLLLLSDILFYNDITMIIAGKEYASAGSRNGYVSSRFKDFKENFSNNLQSLCDSSEHHKLEKSYYLLANQYIFQVKSQFEILEYLTHSEVDSIDTFEYQVLPKLMFEYQLKPISNKKPQIIKDSIVKSTDFLNKLESIDNYDQLNTYSDFMHYHSSIDPASYDIILKAFNYRKAYGYDLIPFRDPVVYTPTTQRCLVTMLGALATQTGALLNGLQDIGKKEIIRGLASLLGKDLLFINRFTASYDFFSQLIFGAVKNGYWIVCENIQEYPASLLSTFAQQIFLVRQALAMGKPWGVYGATKFELKADADWAIFATHSLLANRVSSSLESVPKNFTDCFRCVNFVNPHLAHILAMNFEVFKLPEPRVVADRVITFFQMLTNSLDNQIFFQDNITIEDLEQLANLNLKPSMSMVKKMLKYMARKVGNAREHAIGMDTLWSSIKIALSGMIHGRAVSLIHNLFCVVFKENVEE